METLADRISRDGPLNELDAVGWAIRLAKRIEALHALGVAHGSISPDIIITTAADRTSKGILVDVRSTPSRLSCQSPERAAGGTVSASDDVWAIAATLYELLTGSSAFGGSTDADTRQRVANASPPPLAVFDVGDDDLQHILDGVFQRDPAARTASAGTLRRALEEWHPDLAVRGLPPLEDEDATNDDDEDDVRTVMRGPMYAEEAPRRRPVLVGQGAPPAARSPQVAAGVTRQAAPVYQATPPGSRPAPSAQQAHPSAQQAYPPGRPAYSQAQQGASPPQPGFLPARQAPPAQPPSSAQRGYPPAQQGYPPAQQGYQSAQQPYPPSQQGYALRQAQPPYPSSQQGPAPGQQSYPSPARQPYSQGQQPPAAQQPYPPAQQPYPSSQPAFGAAPPGMAPARPAVAQPPSEPTVDEDEDDEDYMRTRMREVPLQPVVDGGVLYTPGAAPAPLPAAGAPAALRVAATMVDSKPPAKPPFAAASPQRAVAKTQAFGAPASAAFQQPAASPAQPTTRSGAPLRIDRSQLDPEEDIETMLRKDDPQEPASPPPPAAPFAPRPAAPAGGVPDGAFPQPDTLTLEQRAPARNIPSEQGAPARPIPPDPTASGLLGPSLVESFGVGRRLDQQKAPPPAANPFSQQQPSQPMAPSPYTTSGSYLIPEPPPRSTRGPLIALIIVALVIGGLVTLLAYQTGALGALPGATDHICRA